MTIPFWDILKKDEATSIYLNLNDETLFRLNKSTILKTILLQKLKKEKQ